MEKKLRSKEANVMLWKEEDFREPDRYFYTDYKDNILFNGNKFLYATPFSDYCALINDGAWKIIDTNQKEIILLPEDITIDAINGMFHKNIAVFDKKSNHWGSYHFSSEEKTFELGIPFIWDTLEFSRKKEIVYGGKNRITGDFHADNLDEWVNLQLEVPLIAMPIEDAQTTDYYKKYIEYYKDEFFQTHIKYRTTTYSSDYTYEQVKKQSEDNIQNAQYNIAFFFETADEHPRPQKVEVGDFKTYKKVLGKMKER